MLNLWGRSLTSFLPPEKWEFRSDFTNINRYWGGLNICNKDCLLVHLIISLNFNFTYHNVDFHRVGHHNIIPSLGSPFYHMKEKMPSFNMIYRSTLSDIRLQSIDG